MHLHLRPCPNPSPNPNLPQVLLTKCDLLGPKELAQCNALMTKQLTVEQARPYLRLSADGGLPMVSAAHGQGINHFWAETIEVAFAAEQEKRDMDDHAAMARAEKQAEQEAEKEAEKEAAEVEAAGGAGAAGGERLGGSVVLVNEKGADGVTGSNRDRRRGAEGPEAKGFDEAEDGIDDDDDDEEEDDDEDEDFISTDGMYDDGNYDDQDDDDDYDNEVGGGGVTGSNQGGEGIDSAGEAAGAEETDFKYHPFEHRTFTRAQLVAFYEQEDPSKVRTNTHHSPRPIPSVRGSGR